MSGLELYYSRNSPFARKVLIVARELGFRDQLKLHEQSPSPTKLSPDLHAHNPLATVPTLITPQGVPLFDSQVIVQYLDAISTAGKILPPASDVARWEALTYDYLANGLLGAMLLVRYEGIVRTPEQQNQAWLDGQLGKAKRGVLRLSQLPLPETNTSGPLSLQAIDLLIVVWYLDRRFSQLKWREWEGASVLTAWYEQAEKRKSWVDEVAPPV